MSTDIFHINQNSNHPGPNPFIHLSPLQVYLAASLPLTTVVILIWAALHWLEQHRESLKARAQLLEPYLHFA